MQTDEGGITRQDGEYAAGIFPLRGFFNKPLEGGVIPISPRIQPPREEWFSLVIPAYAGDNREVGQNR